MEIPAITEMDVRGKRLVVRADLNVPMSEGRVTDATRITRFAEGVKPLLAKGARLVILTHYGRPKGKVVAEMSVDQLRPTLAEALAVDVAFCATSSGPEAEAAAAALQDGQAILMENVRFDPREEANDSGLGALFARLGDVYVNDAFSCAHRAHASTEAVATLMPSVAGPLMSEEINALQNALEAPESPAIAIVGGAKVSTKIAVLKNLVKKLDGVIVGGGMANTFLFADGAPMGASLHEPDQIDTVKEIRALAAEHNCTLYLPEDVACGAEFKAGTAMSLVPAAMCPEDQMILDAGPQAVTAFSDALATAKTILWNGPLGAFEIPPFDKATNMLAQKAAELTRNGGAVSVAGGGDTVSALIHAGVKDDFTYVSSAGGAFLEWLEGKTLPGIAALMRSDIAA
ncbi:phosphoglycerate kinase [Alisedimentitalea sp. MJ-SS2]|uniref:phosphoglycerate kinase n=1 Tax=Aliisedimentitalea sp. MJ-SS2 TaxID=3049795 RepID=UPI00290C21A6|nr:phosphoglycerate kinase [Alisedimentitalea sp. MJ-SS2]MDU8928147.1 phosphoglycerate kinase [Alisedimentitalea sp. MJ-SS2]